MTEQAYEWKETQSTLYKGHKHSKILKQDLNYMRH